MTASKLKRRKANIIILNTAGRDFARITSGNTRFYENEGSVSLQSLCSLRFFFFLIYFRHPALFSYSCILFTHISGESRARFSTGIGKGHLVLFRTDKRWQTALPSSPSLGFQRFPGVECQRTVSHALYTAEI